MHSETKSATMTNSFRLNFYFASTVLDDLLDYIKAKTDTFTIQLSGSLKLSETGKKLWEVLFVNPWTRILDTNSEKMVRLMAVGHLDDHRTIFCEFDCILN